MIYSVQLHIMRLDSRMCQETRNKKKTWTLSSGNDYRSNWTGDQCKQHANWTRKQKHQIWGSNTCLRRWKKACRWSFEVEIVLNPKSYRKRKVDDRVKWEETWFCSRWRKSVFVPSNCAAFFLSWRWRSTEEIHHTDHSNQKERE